MFLVQKKEHNKILCLLYFFLHESLTFEEEVFYLAVVIVLFNYSISTVVDRIFQLLPLSILDALFGLIVNQVLGTEQKQSLGFLPVNFQLIDSCADVWCW